MGADPDLDVSRLERRKPDTLAEPPAWDVSVGVYDPLCPRLVLSGRPAQRAVVGVAVLAVSAAALAGGVRTERAVAVTATGRIGQAPAERLRVGEHAQSRPRRLRHGEQ